MSRTAVLFSLLVAAVPLFLPPLLVAADSDLVVVRTALSAQAIEDDGKDFPPEPAAKTVEIVLKRAAGKDFVAVTANPYATAVASDILLEGGSAIDAAIAAQMVLGLVEPQSSGIGGGGFLLHWRADRQKLEAYDGREAAPLAADGSLFIDVDSDQEMAFFDAVVGGRSVGVPGLLAMLAMAHAEHGMLPWSALLQPAINLAEKGFVVSSRLHSLISTVPRLRDRDELQRYLFGGKGEPLAVGDYVTNNAYAGALRQVARDRGESFYHGEMADVMVSAVNGDGNAGEMSRDDFSRYRALSRQPLCRVLFGYRICGMGPPSSGASTVLSILGTMSRLEERSGTLRDGAQPVAGISTDIDRAHYFIEASRLAFSDRNAYLADPEFSEVPLQELLDRRYLAHRAALVRRHQAMAEVLPGRFPGVSEKLSSGSPEMESTTHMSLVDRHGNIVSMTSSIESAFGSRLMVDGFILNNQLTDFSFVPRRGDGSLVSNRVEGGKRPRSSMSPMIVFNSSGEPVMAIGSPGGKRIIAYVARVLYEVLALGRPLGDAVDDAHILHIGSRLEVEYGVPEFLLEGLRSRGHAPLERPQASGLHALVRDTGRWHGIADLRREGSVGAR